MRRPTTIAFSWDIPEKDSSKKALLYQKLFGHEVTKTLKDGTKKTYYYGGILKAWVNGKRVVNCHHYILGDSLFSIPDMMEEEGFVPKILDAFRSLDIPVRHMRLVENELHTWKDGH